MMNEFWIILLLAPLLPALCSLLTLGCVHRAYTNLLCGGAIFLALLLWLAAKVPALFDDLSLPLGYVFGMISFTIGSHKMFFNDSPKWWRFLLVRLTLIPVFLLVALALPMIFYWITFALYYQTLP